MLIVLLVIAVAAGAYWVGVQSATERRRDDRRAGGVAGPTRMPHSTGARPWLLAAAVVGGIVLLGLLVGGPALFGPMAGPGFFGGPGGPFGP